YYYHRCIVYINSDPYTESLALHDALPISVNMIHHSSEVGSTSGADSPAAWRTVAKQSGICIIKRTNHRKLLAVIKLVDAHAADITFVCTATTGHLTE